MARTGGHRKHLPHELGPRLEKRGRYYSADLRPWGGSRYTSLRLPSAPGWPDAGDRTEDRDRAEQWKWKYVDLLKSETRDEQEGRPRRRLLGKALDDYERHRKRHKSEGTVAGDLAIVKFLRAKYGEHSPITNITAPSLQRIFDDWLDADYQVSTLHTRKGDISAFFAWLGGPNPARAVVLPAVETAEDPYAWSDEDVAALRLAADAMQESLDVRLLLELGLGTGARLGELLALRWSDFNEVTRTVRIVRQFRSGTTRVVGLKGKKSRTALVLPEFWPFYRLERGTCITVADHPTKSHIVYPIFQRLLDAVKLNGDGRSVHDTRRTYGRIFLERGGRLEELQRFLGHVTITTTERGYGRFTGERAAELARLRFYGAHKAQDMAQRGGLS